jgi:hypothetical protein
MPRVGDKICRIAAPRGVGNSHSIPSPEDYHKCNSAQRIRLTHSGPQPDLTTPRSDFGPCANHPPCAGSTLGVTIFRLGTGR